LRLPRIAALISGEASLPAGEADAGSARTAEEVLVADEENRGRVSTLTCPECNGALWELKDEGILQFRCRIGHIYSPDSLLEQQAATVDRALWAALRSLEERAALCRKLSSQAIARGLQGSGEQFLRRALEIDRHADVLRDLISRKLPSLETPDYAEGGSSEAEDGSPEAATGEPSTSR
jgi:hypothetical protein